MAIRQGRVVALAPGLAAAAQQLVEQLRGLGVQADLAAAADQPGLTIWVAAAADQTRLACLMQTLAARCPGAVQWVAAADADLLALQALALAQEVLALPVEAGELAWRWQRHGVPAAAPAVPELLPGIVGNSAPLVAALAVLGRFAACDAGVLVLGETGTGKELFAQALHRLSARGAKPFVALNCAAMPADLIESELFGHTRGAFTSAAAARSGLIHEAEGGTLFLDDIDGLPAAAQAKLLRFLQEHEYRVVGGNTVQRANVRVVAASNRPLGQMVKLGQFRADLFYRLNILTLSLPPLRQRLDDLAALAAYTLGPDKALSAATLARLRQHAWPGNVRELGHVLARARVLSDGPLIEPEHLLLEGDEPMPVQEEPVCGGSLRQAKQQFEWALIDSLLRSHAGNVTQAAAAAKKDRRAFIALMRKHAIESAAYRVAGSNVGV